MEQDPAAGPEESKELERIEKFLKESPSQKQLEEEASGLWDANPGRPSLREIACRLMEAAGHGETEGKQLQMMQCWALTGKAWLERGSYDAALRCLSRVKERQVAPGEPSQWAEVLMQTQLWTATALLHKASYNEAMAAFAKAAKLRPEQTSWKAAEAMVLLRERGEMKVALELVNHLDLEGPKSLRPFGSKATVAEVLRQRSLCLLELKDLPQAEAQARKVLTMELSETTGRARSLKILLKVLCAKECLQDPTELQELSLDLMSQKRATLADCIETCRVIAESGFDRLFVKCLQRLRRRSLDAEEQRELRLFGAQMLAARVEEVMCSEATPADKEFAVDTLCAWVDEARNLEDAVVGVGHLLWNLARTLKPQEALLWLQKALSFLPEAPLWRAMAFCNHTLGDGNNRRRCLEAALKHCPNDVSSNLLLLVDAAVRGEALTVQRVVEKMKQKEVKVTANEVIFVVRELQSLEISQQHLVILDLLLKLAEEEKSSALCSASVLQMYLEAASHLGPQHLIKAMERVKDIALQEDQKIWLRQLLVTQAQACVQSQSWRLCAKLMQETAELLPFGEDKAVQCASAAQALLRAEPQRQNRETASSLCEEALDWIRRGLAALEIGTVTAVEKQLRDLEAEAAGRLGQVVSSLKCAWAALEAHPQVTIQILQGHQFDAKAPAAAAAAAAAAGRECLRLLLLHGHFAEALQEVQRLQEMQTEAPNLESLWLAATVWNAGAKLLDTGDHSCGRQFLQKATALMQDSGTPELKSMQQEMRLQLMALA